jgi:NAD(P)-dependent dehydrogenase (short-subunit alcohol dehydrogenase family)
MSSRNIVITGGAGGLGKVMREQFLSHGDQVHIADVKLDFDAVNPPHPRLRGSTCDVGDNAAVERLFTEVAKWMPHIDVLINNVGIAGPRAPLEAVTDAQWLESLQINLLGAIRSIRQVLPGMKAAGRGVILNISTSSVVTRPLNRSPYVVTKGAIETLTTALARELGPHGIRCNALRPGMMDNERMHGVLRRVANDTGQSVEQLLESELKFVSLRTMIPMQDVAGMALFLTSEAAARITGQVIAVDGGCEWES